MNDDNRAAGLRTSSGHCHSSNQNTSCTVHHGDEERFGTMNEGYRCNDEELSSRDGVLTASSTQGISVVNATSMSLRYRGITSNCGSKEV